MVYNLWAKDGGLCRSCRSCGWRGEGDSRPHLLLGRYRAGLAPAEGSNVAKAATFETSLFVVVCKDLHDAVKDAIMCIDCNEVR